LERECSVGCGGAIDFRYQGDLAIKTELLRVDFSCDYFRLAGSLTDPIELPLLGDDSEIPRDSKVSVFDAIEGCDISGIVGFQTFLITLADDPLILGMSG